MDMVGDHRPVVEELVREFYANIQRRRGDSFWAWVREKAIYVTPTLISTITGAPLVCDLEYL
jgi:hypothetical protein